MGERAVLRPSLHLLDQVWHKRDYPQQLGATLHRYGDDAILVCRQSAKQALEAFEAIARRMGLEVNHEKTRIPKRTDGFDFVGYAFVKRRSPSTGKWRSSIFPSQTSQRQMRRRIKYCTKRRSPVPRDAFVRQVNQAVRGWGQYYTPTKASQAFRALQRCLTPRLRRYLTFRSTGRGFGWHRYPTKRRYAMGLISIGSGLLRRVKAPGQAL